MPHKILSEDWSDYDNKKKKKEDALFFSCEESWERDYLIRKIRKVYPQYSEALVTAAIVACCLEVRASRPRKAFVECVMRRLRS
jgi:hypothetical protein